MRPPRSILSREFKYVNAANTSLARMFARIRAEQRKAGTVKPTNVAALPTQGKKVRR